MTPEGYDQLYTIHALQGDINLPCIYALLPGRRERDYKRLLEHVLALVPDCAPATIVTDFELAAINAFQETFPEVIMTGCHFHLGQNIWRRLQAEGLQAKYVSDVAFASKVKCLTALAFLPPDRVTTAYEELIRSDAFRELDPLLDYFEENYIGRARRGRRATPRFPIPFWNQHQRVLGDLPRSNNNLEGWHQAFNHSVGIAHPSAARLAQKLQKEQHLHHVKYRQYQMGLPPQKKKKHYQRVNQALRTMVSEFLDRDTLQFLTDVGRVLNINVL